MIPLAAVEFLDDQLIPGASAERTKGMKDGVKGIELAFDPELRLVHIWRDKEHSAVAVERTRRVVFKRAPPRLKREPKAPPTEAAQA